MRAGVSGASGASFAASLVFDLRVRTRTDICTVFLYQSLGQLVQLVEMVA